MIIVLITSACSDKTPPKIVKEPKTPDTISKVVIGTQTWMTYNLDVTNFRNGEEIPEAKSQEEWIAAGEKQQAAWCYCVNDPKNGTKYGKLYNWYAANDARGLAPMGWHVPTDQEWTVLSTFLGGEDVAGEKMKSSSGWKDGNGNNSSGFTGLPGGIRYFRGVFSRDYCVVCDGFGSWWSASETSDSNAWYRELASLNSYLYRGPYNRNTGLSVRCVKD